MKMEEMKVWLGVIAGSAILAGCMSVEGTRRQLQSNDAAEIKKAESNILLVVEWPILAPLDEPKQYVDLVESNELLVKIIERTGQSDTQVAAINRLDWNKPGMSNEVVAKILKNAQWWNVQKAAIDKLDPTKPGTPNCLLLQMLTRTYDDNARAAISEKIDLSQSGIGMDILTKYKNVLTKYKNVISPTEKSFVDKVIAVLSEDELRHALDMEEVDYDKKKLLARQLISVTTNAELLLSIYDNDGRYLRYRIDNDDRDSVVVKLARLADQIKEGKVIAKVLDAEKDRSHDKCIEDTEVRANLLSRLSDEEAVKYALDALKGHNVYSWNKDDMLPLNDAISVAKAIKNSDGVVKIVSAILVKIESYQKACSKGLFMSWGKEDADKADALIKGIPKFDDATLAVLICADATSWRYFLDSISADVAYKVLADKLWFKQGGIFIFFRS